MFACALCLPAPPAHADYRDNYGKGLEAYKDGHLAEARQFFAAARDEHPEPSIRIRLYGQRYEPYVPQHYLGLIGIAQGDCAGAAAQWSAAGNAEVVAQIPDLSAEEKSASSKCGALAQVKPASPPVPPPKPAAASEKPVTPPAPAPEQPKVVVAQTTPPKPAEPAAKPVPAPVEKPAVEKPVVADGKPGPPDQLILAFDKFLSGNLGEVSRINPEAFGDARARFHAYLVRSGARYTLSQINNDRSMLDAARADARAAHAINAGISPDPTLFSPHFLSFYAESR